MRSPREEPQCEPVATQIKFPAEYKGAARNMHCRGRVRPAACKH